MTIISKSMKTRPEERLMSLEMSLLHFKIDARSAALRVDSWSSWLSGFPSNWYGEESTLNETASVWVATSEENIALFRGC